MIESRENVEKVESEATNLLERLSIGSAREQLDTNKMEWKYGGANLMNQFAKIKNLDSDGDSDGALDMDDYVQNDHDFQKNPLKILASRSEIPNHRVKHLGEKCSDEVNVQADKDSEGDLNSENPKFGIDIINNVEEANEKEKHNRIDIN